MKFYLKILTFSLLGICANASEKPNIIAIIADDMGWSDIGYHNPKVYRPNIDKLVKGMLSLLNTMSCRNTPRHVWL